MKLYHRNQIHTVAVADDIDLFRLQICSLTNVQPENQVLHISPGTDSKPSATTTTTTTTTTVILPAHSTTPTAYTISFQNLMQLLQAHPTTVACLIDPYPKPPRLTTIHDNTATSIANFVAPIVLQDRTQTVLGSMPSNNASQFIGRLQNASRHVLMYEDLDLQRYALSKIPLSKLYSEATEDASKDTTKDASLTFGDHLLKRFGSWFRHKFFTWMNGIPCSTCNHPTTKCIGATRPNAEEQQAMAGTVEVYQCNACGAHTRFPRYNHPRKLLETRIGRCGEFANCFTLFCRALGYDSRHVTDWTDHVWTEIYSCNLEKWISFDSCENAWNSPLMYSSGWGKKLTYVVACSRNDVVDVSARYVAKYPEMLARRTLVNEVWLAKCIDVLDLTARLRDAKKEGTNLHDWSMQASRRKREATSLEDRRNGGDGLLKASSNAHATGERKENQLTEAERRGRTTGSVEWRAARGELGRTADAKTRALNVKCTTDLSGPVSPNVTTIQVRAGNLIDCISFTVDGATQHFGDNGGGTAQAPFGLTAEEYIVSLSGRCGDSLDALRCHTSIGRESEWGNSEGGSTFRIDAPVGMQIVGVVRGDGVCGRITHGRFAPAPVSSGGSATATATASPDKKRAKHESMSPMSPQQRMQARVKEVFESLVQEGKSPNEAACLALQVVREENNSSKKE